MTEAMNRPPVVLNDILDLLDELRVQAGELIQNYPPGTIHHSDTPLVNISRHYTVPSNCSTDRYGVGRSGSLAIDRHDRVFHRSYPRLGGLAISNLRVTRESGAETLEGETLSAMPSEDGKLRLFRETGYAIRESILQRTTPGEQFRSEDYFLSSTEEAETVARRIFAFFQETVERAVAHQVQTTTNIRT